MSMNSSSAAPARSQPWKNSIFNLPKKPSHLALPGLHPFPGIDLTRPFSSHILIHPGQRQWQPRSEWILGWSPSPSHLHAPSSDGLAISASGEVDTDQLSGMPPEQWGTVYADDKLAAAIIDHAMHHGRLVEFGGPGHRLGESPVLGKGQGDGHGGWWRHCSTHWTSRQSPWTSTT